MRKKISYEICDVSPIYIVRTQGQINVARGPRQIFSAGALPLGNNGGGEERFKICMCELQKMEIYLYTPRVLSEHPDY